MKIKQVVSELAPDHPNNMRWAIKNLKMLAAIEKHGPVSSRKLEDYLNISYWCAWRHVQSLLEMGLISRNDLNTKQSQGFGLVVTPQGTNKLMALRNTVG